MFSFLIENIRWFVLWLYLSSFALRLLGAIWIKNTLPNTRFISSDFVTYSSPAISVNFTNKNNKIYKCTICTHRINGKLYTPNTGSAYQFRRMTILLLKFEKNKFGSLWFRLIHQETYIHPKIYLYNQILSTKWCLVYY